MHSFPRPTNRARFAAATLLAACLLAGSVSSGATDVARVAAKGKPSRGDDVEARIKTLHSQLHITAEQEPAWNPVAQVMRDNAKTMLEFRRQKAEKQNAASAVDALKSYASIIDAHADGVRKFIPIFQALYDSMPEAQKKIADTVFRNRGRAGAERHKP